MVFLLSSCFFISCILFLPPAPPLPPPENWNATRKQILLTAKTEFRFCKNSNLNVSGCHDTHCIQVVKPYESFHSLARTKISIFRHSGSSIWLESGVQWVYHMLLASSATCIKGTGRIKLRNTTPLARDRNEMKKLHGPNSFTVTSHQQKKMLAEDFLPHIFD